MTKKKDERTIVIIGKRIYFLFNKKLFNLNCKMKLRITLYERVSIDIIPLLWIRSSSAIPNTGEKEILVSNGSKNSVILRISLTDICSILKDVTVTAVDSQCRKLLFYLLKMTSFYLVLFILRKLSKASI